MAKGQYKNPKKLFENTVIKSKKYERKKQIDEYYRISTPIEKRKGHGSWKATDVDILFRDVANMTYTQELQDIADKILNEAYGEKIIKNEIIESGIEETEKSLYIWGYLMRKKD